MATIVGIAIAGALGALARYGLDTELRRDPQTIPWITFAINVTGSFLLGLAVAHFDAHPPREAWLRPTLTIGLLGAYTTFSTFSLETYRLLARGQIATGLGYAGGSVVAGLAALAAGVVVGRAV
jgi:CrcB protein